MQILSYVLTGISIILIIVMLFTFRKVHSVSIKAPLISILVSLVGFIIYKAIVGTSLSAQLLWVLAIVGTILGMWQGKKTNVWIEDGKRKAQNTMWFIIVWALGFGFNQLLVVTGQALSMNLGIGALSLSTGISMGAQGIIFTKLVKARPQKTLVTPSSTLPAAQAVIGRCSKCGINNLLSQNYCSNCGQPLLAAINTPSNPAAPPQKVTVKKVSGVWWILPVFLGLLGGIIAFAAVVKRSPGRAIAMLIFGLCQSIFVVVIIWNILNTLSDLGF